MKSTNGIGVTSMVLVLLLAAGSGTLAEEWDLSGVDRVELDGVSGDVILLGSGRGAWVELEADVRPRGAFEAVADRAGSTLRLEEEWGPGSASGEVTWTFHLPSGGAPAIEISTASGSLEAEDLALDLQFNTASGDIDLRNVDLGRDSDFNTASGSYRIENMTVREGVRFRTASGDIELLGVDVDEGVTFTSASGDVEARDSTGSLSLKSASGDVTVRDSRIIGEGHFTSASGDVSLSIDEVPPGGISASSASGDVFLDAAGLGGSYTLVMVVDQRKGRIDSPFEPTSRRTFERNRREYEEQRVERGSGGPEIALESHSGKVRVRN